MKFEIREIFFQSEHFIVHLKQNLNLHTCVIHSLAQGFVQIFERFFPHRSDIWNTQKMVNERLVCIDATAIPY